MTGIAVAKPIFSRETFRFFRDLARHNQKAWMDANRERYQQFVVQPFRRFFEATAPAVLELDSRFDICGRTGANVSRINRDIRFAKDKTPYRPQIYLRFTAMLAGGRESGQLYAGISADTATAGYAIYAGPKRKESALALIAEPRVHANPKWLAQQKKRLGRRYESYWYSAEKREWAKHDGWPMKLEDWKKIQGWVVRRKFAPAAATRASYPRDVAKIFRELFPLLRFTSLRD
jgi:uncharacterized protein (TIGR02453 family)